MYTYHKSNNIFFIKTRVRYIIITLNLLKKPDYRILDQIHIKEEIKQLTKSNP